MFFRLFLIVLEVVFITILDYKMASHYYSLDVLYCLPVIQTARFNAFQNVRGSNSKSLAIIAFICGLAWSSAEAAVVWPNFPISAFLMNVITRGITFTVIGRVVTALWKNKEHTQIDELTGLAGRAEFIKHLETKQQRSAQSGTPFSLLLFNIRRFRKLNDYYGHAVGDEVLKVVANTLQENSRSVDFISRIGSDEFVLLLPETDQKVSAQLATRITRAAENKFAQHNWDVSLSVSHTSETGNKKSVDELLCTASEEMKLKRES